MINLILSLTLILTAYCLLFFLFMKKEIAWKYKAFIYGLITYLMLVSTFVAFSHYDKNWREITVLPGETAVGGAE